MFYMKIKLYFGMENAIKKSGIGRAFYHQKKALTLNNIEFTIAFPEEVCSFLSARQGKSLSCQ